MGLKVALNSSSGQSAAFEAKVVRDEPGQEGWGQVTQGLVDHGNKTWAEAQQQVPTMEEF